MAPVSTSYDQKDESIELNTPSYHDDPEQTHLDPSVSIDKSLRRRNYWSFWFGAFSGSGVLLLVLTIAGVFVHTTDVGSKFLDDQIQRLQRLRENADTLGSGQSDKLRTTWTDIDTFFFFGDSYSTTGHPFAIPNIIQLDNPYVNGQFAQAPRWPSFVANVYNHTVYNAFNFATGGSTVDNTLVQPFLVGNSLRGELVTFIERFNGTDRMYDWRPENSVFVIWFGVNDIAMTNEFEDLTAMYTNIFHSYEHSLTTMYEAGARNFLLMTVPPFLRSGHADLSSDMITYNGRLHNEIFAHEHIVTWNSYVERARQHLRHNYTDASAQIFDAQRFFAALLEHPKDWEQMDGVKDVVGVCDSAGGDPWWDERCQDGTYLREHAWIPIHPTYPVQNATAAQVMKDCFGEDGFKGFCV